MLELRQWQLGCQSERKIRSAEFSPICSLAQEPIFLVIPRQSSHRSSYTQRSKLITISFFKVKGSKKSLTRLKFTILTLCCCLWVWSSVWLCLSHGVFQILWYCFFNSWFLCLCAGRSFLPACLHLYYLLFAPLTCFLLSANIPCLTSMFPKFWNCGQVSQVSLRKVWNEWNDPEVSAWQL